MVRTQPARSDSESERVKRTIREKKNQLGSITAHELQVLVLFIILVLLWFFKTPRFIEGWSSYFKPIKVHSATPAILIIAIVFILPTKYNFWPFVASTTPPTSSPALLNWHTVEKRLPWGVIILLGGGFALAGASKSSGLSAFIGAQLDPLKVITV